MKIGKEYLKWCSFSCFGEVPDVVIGDNSILLAEFTILLAKILFYWRFSQIYWRKTKFIRELEISRDFFQFAKQKIPGENTRFSLCCCLGLPIHA